MLVCEVVGTVVATRKVSSFIGYKLLVVSALVAKGRSASEHFVAVDTVGAGLGDKVIVTQGSSARLALEHNSIPVDAAIVGIVDAMEVQGK